MGMAQTQDIPNAPKEKSEWSIRRLLGGGAVSGVISKTFINVFDVLLGFCVLIIGVAEVADRDVSWLFYILTVLFFLAAFVERRATALKEEKK